MSIKKPDDFKLYCIIYQPLVLMTSRQCLFHQVSGCEKHSMDDSCIPQCEKHSTISNLKKETFIIEKTKGNYHSLYSGSNMLNTDVVTDIPNLFSSFFIDLSDIKTETKIEKDKASIIELFKKHLSGDSESTQELHHIIHLSNNIQYKVGI